MSDRKTPLLKMPDGTNYLFPFIMITSLFLLWGFAHGLLDVLNKHFQEILSLSKGQSGFIQFSLYIAYFVMAIPAGIFIKKYGYKKGIMLGLFLFACGAFLFLPAASLASFFPFLIALFVLACGLACLETAANPYSTILGPPEQAARRINISQSFNGLGWILGPLLGGLLIFGAEESTEATKFDSVTKPYLYVGVVVLVVLLIFAVIKLPKIIEKSDTETQEDPPMRNLLRHPFFIFAVVAQFLYVAAQTGINSFFINYVIDALPDVQQPIANIMGDLGWFGRVFMPKNPEQAASLILAIGGMGMFFVGRLTGAWFMKFISPSKLLLIYAAINTILMLLVVMHLGWLSVVALFMNYFFMSIMFPTIFALGVSDLGPLTEKGASFLVMAVAGGAFCPPIMGWLADTSSMAISFIIPLVCFFIIAWFAMRGTKQKLDPAVVQPVH